MTISTIISTVFLVLFCIAFLAACVILFGTHLCTPLQRAYLLLFDHRSTDAVSYKKAKQYIKGGGVVPVLTLEDYCYRQTYMEEEWKRFVKETPYYLIMFTRGLSRDGFDLCLYTNDEITISSFYGFLTREIAYLSGQTRESLIKIHQDGIEQDKIRKAAIEKKIKDLESQLARAQCKA